jgi:hypothetical protein
MRYPRTGVDFSEASPLLSNKKSASDRAAVAPQRLPRAGSQPELGGRAMEFKIGGFHSRIGTRDRCIDQRTMAPAMNWTGKLTQVRAPRNASVAGAALFMDNHTRPAHGECLGLEMGIGHKQLTFLHIARDEPLPGVGGRVIRSLLA